MLCEFAAKAGDFDLLFTPAQSARQGLAGHVLLGLSQPVPEETEMPLQRNVHTLNVGGRSNGLDLLELMHR